jgi:hypothetical protein
MSCNLGQQLRKAMRLSICLAFGLLTINTAANATTVAFNSDPFAGTAALTDPGRQIVGGPGTAINFDIATDVFSFDRGVFGVDQILFANDLAANLPATGINTVVLLNGAPLAAGTAANLIAAQITDAGPGFFIYFNTVLDLPRLVYSTDLSDDNADLAILGRLINLNGPGGFAALPAFTAANFTATPEPSTFLLTSAGALLTFGLVLRRRRSRG